MAAQRLRHDEFEENGADQVRVHWDGRLRPNRSLLLQFDSGVGAVVAIRPGFIGTILVDDGRVVNVSYLPSCPPGDSSAHRREAGEIAKRHAYVAAAARHGLFHLDSSLAPKVASSLRTPGGIDATLGLYAAYASAQGGEFEAVRSVYDEMAAAPAAVPGSTSE